VDLKEGVDLFNRANKTVSTEGFTPFGCANGVPETRRGKSGRFLDLLGARLGPWNEFALAEIVEGVLTSKFTRGPDCPHHGRKIVIRAEIVVTDYGGILKLIAGKADRTFAGGLHN